MLQQILVTLIVAYAAWSTIRRYFPKSALTVQRWLRKALANLASQCGHNQLAQKLLMKNDIALPSSACGGCSGCDSSASKTCATSKTTNTTVTKIICTPQALQQTIRRQ